MPDRPGALGWLDRQFAAATLAHERIADLQRRAGTERARELLRESAEIVLWQIPNLTRGVTAAAVTWDEQQLLDPPQAQQTLRLIEAQISEIENELVALRGRQIAIARELEP